MLKLLTGNNNVKSLLVHVFPVAPSMNQKSITQYFIVNSSPLNLIRFCSCHFCVLKHGKRSWVLLWSVWSPQAHICNANTKSNLWRQNKKKTKTAILALPTGPSGLALNWRCRQDLGCFWAMDQHNQLLQQNSLAQSHSSLSLRPCSGDGPAVSSWWLLSLFPVDHSHWTSRKSFPRLPLHTSPSHSHHKAEVWVLQGAAEGSEKPSLACRWTVTKFSCWAEHSPPDY